MTREQFRDWCFRNRETGEITIGQPPNAPVVICVVALVARRLVRPPRAIDVALGAVGVGAAVFWAGDELIRGVNPWRRMIGATALVGLAITAARH